LFADGPLTLENQIVNLFFFCSYNQMERLDASGLSEALFTIQAWARTDLAVRDPRMHQRAADALAAAVIEDLAEAQAGPNHNQFCLPM
jgi:hypothetical protein